MLALASATHGLAPKMARPMHVEDLPAPSARAFSNNGTTWYLVDFGKEFQGACLCICWHRLALCVTRARARASTCFVC